MEDFIEVLQGLVPLCLDKYIVIGTIEGLATVMTIVTKQYQLQGL